jgi:hypothetical protein
MKKYVFICTAILAGLSATAQDKNVTVPDAVKTAFAKKFPSVKNVEWSKENDKEFEAEFKVGSTEQSANFDTAGTWLETETKIKTSELPSAVSKAIATKYPDYKIEEAEKTEKPGNVITYEVKVEKGETSYEVLVSPDGKIIKAEEEKEDED